MTISKNHLESICNYVEVSSPNSNIQFSYIEMEFEDSDYKRKIQSINRGLAIDAVLDNKEQEYKSRDVSYSETFDSEGYVSSISPKIKTVSLNNPIRYSSLEDIFDYTICELESLTKNSMTGKNFDLSLTFDTTLSDYDNIQQHSRKLVSKILLVSNQMAINSRIGPANSLIVGKKVYDLLLTSPAFSYQISGTGPLVGTIAGLSVVFSNKISDDKLILVKTNKKSDNGLNVINNTLISEFYIKETPNWTNFIHWFKII